LLPTPGMLGPCSRARLRLRALRAVPARALPLPNAGSPALARHGRGGRPARARLLVVWVVRERDDVVALCSSREGARSVPASAPAPTVDAAEERQREAGAAAAEEPEPERLRGEVCGVDPPRMLNRVIPIGERHLRELVSEYVAHYHLERPHQGLGNRLVALRAAPPRREALATAAAALPS
jgi:hypothetical protein